MKMLEDVIWCRAGPVGYLKAVEQIVKTPGDDHVVVERDEERDDAGGDSDTS